MAEPSPRTTYVLVDGENVDATLGTSILSRRPQPEERPRWDRLLQFAEEEWGHPARGLFFLAANGDLPMPFIQALLAMGYRPIPLSGGPHQKGAVDVRGLPAHRTVGPVGGQRHACGAGEHQPRRRAVGRPRVEHLLRVRHDAAGSVEHAGGLGVAAVPADLLEHAAVHVGLRVPPRRRPRVGDDGPVEAERGLQAAAVDLDEAHVGEHRRG